MKTMTEARRRLGSGIEVSFRGKATRRHWNFVASSTTMASRPPTRPQSNRGASMSKYRIEKDSLGEMRVPESAYYGAQTARAVENFPVSGIPFPRHFIRALGIIKRSCARANVELGDLDPKVGEAIAEAATEVIEGKLDAEFPLDIYQTGSGTSTNMNANEVIANRAAEIM